MKIEDHPLGQSLATMNLHPASQSWSPAVRDYAEAAGITYEAASAAAYTLYEKAYNKHWAFGVDMDSAPYEERVDMLEALYHGSMNPTFH